jgi:nicotinamidase-related amidase
MKEEYLNSLTLEKTIDELVAELASQHFRHKPWQLIPGKAALLVLDMQNYFLEPESHAFTPSAPAIVPNILELIEMARKFDMMIIFTKHVNDDKNAGMMGKWWKDVLKDGSWESGISKTVGLYNGKTVREDKETGRQGDRETEEPEIWKIINKSQYDAFYYTDLEEYLRSKNIEQVIITGLMANLCCETTVRSAFVRGFEVFFPVDATAAYNREFHLSTFKNLGFGFCPILKTSDLIKSLNESK